MPARPERAAGHAWDPTVDGSVERHLRACEGFSAVVLQAEGGWDLPSPCTDWDARGVVEHVIGFHDVLLLRPMGTRPIRPGEPPEARWLVTVRAIVSTLSRLSDADTAVEADAPGADSARLLPMLTTDVLVHTWDLARAVGADPTLDPELCGRSLAAVRANEAALRASGMFGPPVPVSDDASVQTELLALLGRHPSGTA